ncbi:MAG: hypothetical protein A2Y97_09275 [Nitrospirae bacterium RBG_13_39_12]|nr:MAG: hypothetical protein A2Y97_09275 [Nitrospirae bacterium RBG_13_39_12]
MISIFIKNRELRQRQTILKGVYEDNLRIIGKSPKTVLGKTPLSIKKIFLFFSITMLVVLGHGNYVNFSLLKEGSIRDSHSHSKQGSFILTAQDNVSSPDNKTVVNMPENNPFFLTGEYFVGPSDYGSFLNIPRSSLSSLFGLEVKTIMIDPGHGGSATGTRGKMGTKEKDIVLDIAKRLRDRLKKYGNYNVIMTRESDTTVPLNKRVELAGLSNADIFISIHLNYLPSKPINIIETYYFGPPSDEKTLKLAETENSGSHYALSDFQEIIEKIGDTLKYQESKALATSIQKKLFLNIKKQDKNVQDYGVKRAPFLVLLGVDVPAILAEVSCLSNTEEEINLNKEIYRENIAYYLEAGILEYLNKGEARYEAKRR